MFTGGVKEESYYKIAAIRVGRTSDTGNLDFARIPTFQRKISINEVNRFFLARKEFMKGSHEETSTIFLRKVTDNLPQGYGSIVLLSWLEQ